MIHFVSRSIQSKSRVILFLEQKYGLKGTVHEKKKFHIRLGILNIKVSCKMAPCIGCTIYLNIYFPGNGYNTLSSKFDEIFKTETMFLPYIFIIVRFISSSAHLTFS